MRLARFAEQGVERIGFYQDTSVIPVPEAAAACGGESARSKVLIESTSLLDFLPPDGKGQSEIRELSQSLSRLSETERKRISVPVDRVALLVPIPHPSSIFLLAGNYAAHIEEGGKRAAARQETFPYVFMKPPKTLTHPGQFIEIPKSSPHSIDWECELGVIIGRRCEGVSEVDALKYVAGYTVINDISDRKFRPNPDRVKRDNDQFFDWLHGKWHDTFCPVGPCAVSADAVPDPQSLKLELRLNGQTKQHASTAQMIFPVAAVIEFLSGIVTLEPGDLISTGTPSGVGAATGTFLQPGDRIEAEIDRIGILCNRVR